MSRRLFVAGDSLLLLSASADPSVRLWQVETGRELYKWPHRGPVRSVVWAEGEREFVTCSDPFGMTVPAAISVFTFADEMSAQVRQRQDVIRVCRGAITRARVSFSALRRLTRPASSLRTPRHPSGASRASRGCR